MRARPDLTTLWWLRAGPAPARGRAPTALVLMVAIMAAASTLTMTTPSSASPANHPRNEVRVHRGVLDRGRSQSA